MIVAAEDTVEMGQIIEAYIISDRSHGTVRVKRNADPSAHPSQAQLWQFSLPARPPHQLHSRTAVLQPLNIFRGCGVTSVKEALA
jgi:hypothetical protein